MVPNLEVAPMLEVVCWRRNFEVKGICLQAIIGLKLIQIQHLSLSIINRSVNVEFSANLVNLLMTLCPPRVLKNFDDDQVLCVRHDKIRCFLWSSTPELAGAINPKKQMTKFQKK